MPTSWLNAVSEKGLANSTDFRWNFKDIKNIDVITKRSREISDPAAFISLYFLKEKNY